jgi:toxin ParE1/3/4
VIVVITAPAVADLREIGDCIAEDSPLFAEKIVSELEDACLKLSRWPERFPYAEKVGVGIRRAVHKRYLIFYPVGKSVEVLRIIHGARNYEAMLADS